MMQYVFAFVGIVVATLGTLLFVLRPSKDERSTIERARRIVGSPEDVPTEDLVAKQLARSAWLQKITSSSALVLHLERTLQQSASRISVESLLLRSLGFGCAGFIVAWYALSSFFAELLYFSCAAVIPYIVLRVRRSRRLKAFDKVLPEMMDVLSRSLKAGHSVPAAFEIAADQAMEPVRSEFQIMSARVKQGLPLRDALIQLADRVPTPDLRIFATAVLVQRESGGNLPQLLERLTAMIRMRVRMIGEMRARTAQGRLTGIILAFTPIFLGLAMKVSSPGYIDPLFSDSVGRILIIYSLCSYAIGATVIYRITRLEV